MTCEHSAPTYLPWKRCQHPATWRVLWKSAPQHLCRYHVRQVPRRVLREKIKETP